MARPERYWSKKPHPEHGPDHYDVIVIGSGMGGMTTAAMLAKLGHKVLVVEQHYVPGGFTHTFRRKGYVWDVGVHAVGEVTAQSMTGRLLDKLTDGRLKWASLGSDYEEFYFPGGFELQFPDNPTQFRENLVAAFPDEVEAIDEYLRLVRVVAQAMKGYYMSRIAPKGLKGKAAEMLMARDARKWFSKTTQEVLDKLTDNSQLRTVFAAQWGYYGSLPANSSFAIQALVVKHFWWGAHYPIGGSGEIAVQLLRTVADAGGWCRIVADVDEILVEGGRAAGVKLTNNEVWKAPIIVSAAGIQSTLKRLLPERFRQQDWAEDTTRLNPASAHVCLYIGFKGDIRQAGAGGANKWFCGTWRTDQENWDISDPDNLGVPPILYTSFPSLKDPEHDPGPDVRHTGECVTFVDWDAFAKWSGTDWRKRGDDYVHLKDKMQEALLTKLLENMPELEQYIDYVELSTPLSTETFVRPMRGSIYGIEPTPERFDNPWLRPKSPIEGLYFSGSEVATVGVIGAMMGGVLGAAAVEPRGAWGLMKR